jgi:hypothetical protein
MVYMAWVIWRTWRTFRIRRRICLVFFAITSVTRYASPVTRLLP